MKNKKIIFVVVIAVILITSVFYIAYVINQKTQKAVDPIKNNGQSEVSTKSEQKQNKENKENEGNEKKVVEIINEKGEKQEVPAVMMSTKVISGKVSKIDGSQIRIDTEKEEKILKITDSTYFYSVINGKTQAKTWKDVKIRNQVTIEYNEADDTALTISL